MNTALDPTILLISETDWNIEKRRDEFLEYLQENLENINEYSLTKMYWNDELENFLWDSPQMPPWRIERDWKIPMVPVINRLLRNNIINLEFSNHPSCSVTPCLIKCPDTDINEWFLKLMHEIINRKEDIFLCLGIENKLSNNNKYSFACPCHSNRICPELINKPDDWLYHIDIENNYWPNNIEEAGKLRKALEIMNKRDNNNKPFLYKYSFSNLFIRDIIHVNRDKKYILDKIIKKLTLNRQESSSSLDDKYLPASVKSIS